MVSGIAAVWMPVNDMSRAVAFYRDVLGLDVRSTSDDWTEIDVDGLLVGLNGREDAAVSDAGGAVVTFRADGTLEDELSRLEQHGVDVTGGISDHEWGRLLPFKDSEGNDLQFFAPPVA
jgi:predicted enzyme related to lactoylglutathione lyase